MTDKYILDFSEASAELQIGLSHLYSAAQSSGEETKQILTAFVTQASGLVMEMAYNFTCQMLLDEAILQAHLKGEEPDMNKVCEQVNEAQEAIREAAVAMAAAIRASGTASELH